MGEDIGGAEVTEADVLAATDWVAPSLEILDTRIVRKDAEGRARVIFDTISDNAANAGIVLGPQRFRPAEVDLPRVGAAVSLWGALTGATGCWPDRLEDKACNDEHPCVEGYVCLSEICYAEERILFDGGPPPDGG